MININSSAARLDVQMFHLHCDPCDACTIFTIAPGEESEGKYVCLSVHLSVCLSICLSVCLAVCLSVCLSVWLAVCLSVYMSVCLPAYLSVWLSVWLAGCLPACLPACLPDCLPACQPSRPPARPPVGSIIVDGGSNHKYMPSLKFPPSPTQSKKEEG